MTDRAPDFYTGMPKKALIERIRFLERINKLQATKMNEAGLEIPAIELQQAMTRPTN